MRDGLDSFKVFAGPSGSPRVLLVVGDLSLRARAWELCETLAPRCHLTDATSVTDAVLLVLSSPVDVVLVDAQLAGDLLHSLVRHVRRSAPQASLSVFGVQAGAPANGRAEPEVMPWTRLRSTLLEVLQVREPQIADPDQ